MEDHNNEKRPRIASRSAAVPRSPSRLQRAMR